MTLAELADRLSVPPRQIRFMIAEGVLPAALKTGRSADAYDEIHGTMGQRYLALHRLGMKPGSIAYSGASGHSFRQHPATDSGASGHPFR